MRIEGVWHLCDDGIVRPVFRGEVQANDGTWIKLPFLVDTGADRTALSADVLSALDIQPTVSNDRLSGIGGMADSVVIGTRIRFTHDVSDKVILSGLFAGFVDMEALDMSVLGRDILNMFALIVDRQGDTVCMIRQQHFYIVATR